ncbi:ORF6C domain-containing protein [Mammaliicoccus sciuri]|uniref:BRO family protein n=1 Tax=Mammaliicoccus sciuri TaxID=1296 RepID=UPI002DBE6900|nr:BRO family protein [Mammaliicoccus sciuri]MEB6226390.1 ORF6C domain-containing protein [Mammaliicoccus sciuri]
MTRELQTFNFEELPVRTLTVNDEPHFVGKDVAEVLGYSRADNAIRNHVDEEDKLTHRFSASGQSRNMIIINESGLYSLIFSSKLDSAKRFKRWVTSEVLPILRKTGSYQVKPLTTSEQIQLIAQGNTELDERVTAIEESYPIMHGQAKHIQQLVARKVAEIVRNKFNGYYKETSKKLFAEIYRSIKKIFQVPTYNSIPRGRYEEAVKFIEQWQPSYDTVYQLELNLKEA